MPLIGEVKNRRYAYCGAATVGRGIGSLSENFHAQREIAQDLSLQRDAIVSEVLVPRSGIVSVAASAEYRPVTKGFLQPDGKKFCDWCAAICWPDRYEDLGEESHLGSPALVVFLD